MRSSTFSFDRRPPDHTTRWFVIAVCVSLAVLAVVEALWRQGGARSSYIESHQRWALQRDEVEKSDHPRRTAILGSSRILFAFSLDAFRQRYPGIPVAQLAIAATGPMATLQSLAYDSYFDGVILLSFNPENLLPPREDEQADYVAYYRSRWSLDHKFNFVIGNWIEPWLVTRHEYYGVNRVLRTLMTERQLPAPALYLSVGEKREHNADFSLADGASMVDLRMPALERRYDELVDVIDEVWPATLSLLADAVGTIHDRGGCVVFIRMPIVQRSLEQDQRVFAGPKYWEDVLSRLGVYGVHYEQIDGVDDIPLPDNEHMDSSNQGRFTNALLDELDELGIYEEGGSCRP